MIKVKLGLYVHIPFCDHICGYCDFARVLYDESLVDNYLSKLEKEILSKNLKKLKTIYIGGGTPSALSLSQLERLFKILDFYTKEIVEYTIEANPESLNQEKALLFKKYGINRISLGMQVSQNHLLKLIERKHSFQQVKATVKMLKQLGINNISIDLMYGIPNQSLADLKESLQAVVNLNIKHLSLYGLTIEPGSKFALKGYKAATADLDADMYEMATDYLNKAGFLRYEISNFAKKGYQSHHNKIYWKYEDFIGVGLYASSKISNQRYTNTRNLKDYLSKNANKTIVNLSKDDQIFEFIMMNLRLAEGFCFKEFKKRFQVDFKSKYAQQIESLVNENLLIVDDYTIRASDYGLEILHNVIEKFMDEV